jgi:DNA/RNA-binding domain of Phe-tRNA-synthetase-like protein
MKININKEVFDNFHSKFKITFISVKGINNQEKLKDSLHLLGEIQHLINLTFNKDQIKNHYLISPWAIAQAEFGKKAIHYQTSVERLLKKTLSNKGIKTKDVLTNLLQYSALKHIVPFGIDDLDKIQGDLTFALSSGREKAVAFRNVKKNALYYKDDKKVLGTKFDYWKNKKTMLDKNTKNALIHFEILPPLNKSKTDLLIKDVTSLIKDFCGGKVKVFTLDKKNKSIKI